MTGAHPKALIEAARQAGRAALSEADGKTLLAAYGVPVPQFRVVQGTSDIAGAIVDLRPPYALKIQSPDILHKSDAGGVALNLPDAAAVVAAIDAMSARPAIREARIDGYLVEEMTEPGHEIVIGAVRDPRFGTMIMVGLGGIMVEILGDVAFRICPIDRDDAVGMLDELRGRAVLDGARGGAAADTDAIVDTLMRIGGADGLLDQLGDAFAEVDINPIIAAPDGVRAVDARFVLAPEIPSPAIAKPKDTLTVAERFRPLFEPETIAVVGASASGVTHANTFIRRLRDFGFAGKIYPIHPKAPEIEGLPAYPEFAATPGPVDYAYVSIGAAAIPELLGRAAGRVRFAQVISSGFEEVAGGEALGRELVDKAAAGGVRLVGPNCLGLHSPRGRVTFCMDPPSDNGTVGVVCQSGGLGTDIIKRGQWRGVRYSALVSAGNCADVGFTELLEFFLDDPATRVIGLYLEDVKDGRRFVELLRRPSPVSGSVKPVVILRGGRSAQGQAAAASHTGALAGDRRAWQALTAQTYSVQVKTPDQFVDALLAFQSLKPRPERPTKRVVLFGNGGGASVLATDNFAELGLDVLPLPDDVRAKLDAMNLPPGTSVANPIDTPVVTLLRDEGRVAGAILDVIYSSGCADAVVLHLNLASFIGRVGTDLMDNLIGAALDASKADPGGAHFVMVLRVDGSPELEDMRRKFRREILANGIPVFDELADAAHALHAIASFERRMR